MRPVIALIACLLLIASAWGGTASASGVSCSETSDQIAVHVAGDCDEVPADAHFKFPHCHTGCHGHHVAPPVLARAAAQLFDSVPAYATDLQPTLISHQIDPTLRPPQA